MLDARLSLAFDLYDECCLAADIGTDHAYLPSGLLLSGRCRKMILTDISPDALKNAQREIVRRRLSDRAELRLGDGLLPLHEKCNMISVLGMGGRTVRHILLSGSDRLQGAKLLLSAHTDLPEVREAVMLCGYHLVSETPCFSNGRFYLLLRADEGAEQLSPQELRLGKKLFSDHSKDLLPYLIRRRDVLSEKLAGLENAADKNISMIRQVREDIDCYARFIRQKKHAE